MKQRVTKQRDLDAMSVDQLFMLHERLTAKNRCREGSACLAGRLDRALESVGTHQPYRANVGARRVAAALGGKAPSN